MTDTPGRRQPVYRLRNYNHAITTLARSRTSQHITLAKMAQRMGHRHLQQISKWLCGAAEPRAGRLFEMANALGYDLALIEREDT